MRPAGAALAFVIGLAACGGKVEEQGQPSTSAPASNTPRNVVADDGCHRACARIASCTHDAQGTSDVERCASSCAGDFGEPGADIYASCIESLTCEDIQRGLTMDYGPIGACGAKAHGH